MQAFSQLDNGHDASGITGVTWGNGNAASFIKAVSGNSHLGVPGGLPALLDPTSRQYGYAVEMLSVGNSTTATASNLDNGIGLGVGVGNLSGAEGIRIIPNQDGSILNQRTAIFVGTDQDNLIQTTNVSFRVLLNGETLIQNNSGSVEHLALVGQGGNGANLRMQGNGVTTPNKYIRVISGTLQVVNDAYSASLFQLTDAGAPSFPALTGGGSVSLCIDASGNLFRGSPGC